MKITHNAQRLKIKVNREERKWLREYYEAYGATELGASEDEYEFLWRNLKEAGLELLWLEAGDADYSKVESRKCVAQLGDALSEGRQREVPSALGFRSDGKGQVRPILRRWGWLKRDPILLDLLVLGQAVLYSF